MGIQDRILITAITKIKNELEFCEKIKNKNAIKQYNVKFDENKKLLDINILFTDNTLYKRKFHIFEHLDIKEEIYVY